MSQGTTRPSDRIADAATVVVALAALLVAGDALHGRFANRGPVDREVKHWDELVRVGYWLGPKSADVVVVEFGDYECPYCKRAEPVLASLRREFPTQFAVVFRHMPLAQHAYAYSAARLAECADRQGSFARVHTTLFSLAEPAMTLDANTIGEAAGVPDLPGFVACAAETTDVARIEADIKAANDLEVLGTPTYVVNGVLWASAPAPRELETRLRELLSTGGAR